jgi:tripeptidyl-peptidase I
LCSFNWANRINAEFMKAGVRGISLLFAAGDSGAAGDNGCSGPKHNEFVPQWPSGSPYVTAVGGTLGNETAVGLGSGGFSNRWARPAWQKDAVETHKKTTKLPTNAFNATGRGFPDISAQAIDFIVVMLGNLIY